MLASLPPNFTTTRDALHAVAEHVVAPARYRAEKRIGLRATPGGFGTPEFGAGEVVRVDGIELVREQRDAVKRAPLTTLRAAAAFVEVPLGAPADVYTPTTSIDPDRALALDAAAADALAGWYAFAQLRLAEICGLHPDEAPGTRQLWPEHFDLAIDLGAEGMGARATYGASPGDDAVAEPYLYVGPWAADRKIGPLAEYPFGAALPYSALVASSDAERAALDFFEACAQIVLAGSG